MRVSATDRYRKRLNAHNRPFFQFFLEGVRSQSIPPGLLPLIFSTENKVKLYDGCVIIEIHDFRPASSSASDSAGPSATGRRFSSVRKLAGDDHFSRNVFLKNVVKAASMSSSQDGGQAVPFTAFRPIKNGANGDSGGGLAGASGAGQSNFVRTRSIMKPDPSTTWEQIVYLNQVYGHERWDDQAALALEARILVSP
jgi:hypothetical protein